MPIAWFYSSMAAYFWSHLDNLKCSPHKPVFILPFLWMGSHMRAATIQGRLLFLLLSSWCSYYSGCSFYSNKYGISYGPTSHTLNYVSRLGLVSNSSYFSRFVHFPFPCICGCHIFVLQISRALMQFSVISLYSDLLFRYDGIPLNVRYCWTNYEQIHSLTSQNWRWLMGSVLMH